MAREYARYLTKTHRDGDWCKLTTAHHDCYMALLSSEDLTWAGVAPYMPARYAGLASDLTEAKVLKLWEGLAAARMLVIDRSTGEVLARTFLRHDNVLAKPNLTKAFISAFGRVRSARIKKAIRLELGKLFKDRPSLAGWKQLEELLPELFRELFQESVGTVPETVRGTDPGTNPGTDAGPSFNPSISQTVKPSPRVNSPAPEVAADEIRDVDTDSIAAQLADALDLERATR